MPDKRSCERETGHTLTISSDLPTAADAARQLIDFLTRPAAIAVIRAQGMEPGR